MTAVESAIVEISAAIAVLLPDQRGLNKFEDIPAELPATKTGEDTLKAEVDRMMALLHAALQANENLVAAGYPVVPSIQVSPEVVAEIQRDLDDLIAVRKLFIATGPPVSGRVTFGTPAD